MVEPVDVQNLRDGFFNYCHGSKARNTVVVLMQDQRPHFSGFKEIADSFFGPHIPRHFGLREEFVKDTRLWINRIRLAALTELVDVESISANQASPEALEYWLIRMRLNDYPEALQGNGVDAYASWLRRSLKVNQGNELIEAHRLQESYRHEHRSRV